jgi:hypothetical protein
MERLREKGNSQRARVGLRVVWRWSEDPRAILSRGGRCN